MQVPVQMWIPNTRRGLENFEDGAAEKEEMWDPASESCLPRSTGGTQLRSEWNQQHLHINLFS